MSSVTCTRCHLDRPAIPEVPYPGDLGIEILQKVCGLCWIEWQQAEVIVINELRLDFMDPKSHDTLVLHMREFLGLDGEPPPTS
jgi:Fe-S cluster biosynthesis and repair protein YggX